MVEMIGESGNYLSIMVWSVMNESDVVLFEGFVYVCVMKVYICVFDFDWFVIFVDFDVVVWLVCVFVLVEVDFVMVNVYFGMWSGVVSGVGLWFDVIDISYFDKMLVIFEFGWFGLFLVDSVSVDVVCIVNL